MIVSTFLKPGTGLPWMSTIGDRISYAEFSAKDGSGRQYEVQLTGEETFTITGVASLAKPGQRCELEIIRPDGSMQTASAISRIDTDNELAYFKNGGILNYVLRGMTA